MDPRSISQGGAAGRLGEAARSSRATRLALAALVAAALALRVRGIGARSIWLDEAWLANLVLLPSWTDFWRELAGWQVPPLFAVALRGLARVVGRSEAGLRGLPLLASVACVPLGYVLGRRVRGPLAGLVVAACLALAPAPVAYGQELKPYSVDVLVVLTVLLAVAEVTRRPSSRTSWLALAVAAALAPGLSYPAALTLPGGALATLLACRTRADVRRCGLAYTVAVVAAVVWYVAIIRAQNDAPHVTAYWARDFAPREAAVLAAWLGSRLAGFAAYALGPPGGVVLALVLGGTLLVPRWLAVSAAATVLLVVAAAVARIYPLAVDRTSLFLLPFVYLPLGALVAWLARAHLPSRWTLTRTVARVAALLPVVPLAFALPRSLQPHAGLIVEDTRPLIQQLAGEREPDDRVYVYHGAVPAFLFYAPVFGLDATSDTHVVLGGRHATDPAAYQAELRPALAPGHRLWILFAHVIPTGSGEPERNRILADVRVFGRELTVEERAGASLHLLEVTRAPGSVRHLRLTPEDLRDPQRLRELVR